MAHGPDTEKLLRRLTLITDGLNDKLDVSDLNITSLPPLPDSLLCLWCYGTKITELPLLPNSLTYLDCSYTRITTLPPLPSLRRFACSHTGITEFPPLPSSLEAFHCDELEITELPPLPDSLKELDCSKTQITKLPSHLPPNLDYLDCSDTLIIELPHLPDSLTSSLYCYSCPNLIIQYIPGKTKGKEYIQSWTKKRVQDRCLAVKEELIAKAFHPSRVEKWLEIGGFELLDTLL